MIGNTLGLVSKFSNQVGVSNIATRTSKLELHTVLASCSDEVGTVGTTVVAMGTLRLGEVKILIKISIQGCPQSLSACSYDMLNLATLTLSLLI